MNRAIQVCGLKKSYDKNIVLSGLDFEILISLLNDLKQKEIHILDMKVDRGTLEQHFIEMSRRKTE